MSLKQPAVFITSRIFLSDSGIASFCLGSKEKKIRKLNQATRGPEATYHQVCLHVCLDVLVHEVEYGQPQGREGVQRQQHVQVLKEHLAQQVGGAHSRLIHADRVAHVDRLQQLRKQWEEHLVEARLPLHRVQGVQVGQQQRPVQERERVRAHRSARIAAVEGNGCKQVK